MHTRDEFKLSKEALNSQVIEIDIHSACLMKA